jgi:hypothetical protein
MKTKVMKMILAVATLIGGVEYSISQGFGNLNFERAVITPDPSSPYYPYGVFAASAIPGWTAYTYGNPQSDIIFNTLSLGAAWVTLQGPGSPESIPQGSYAILLQGSSGGPPGGAAIGQTGFIPVTARSLIFWGGAGLDNVSFNGQTLSLIQAGTTAHYNIYEADISGLAGQTGQLLFTAPAGYWATIDNIQLSSTPVPEPSEIALAVMGALFLGLRCRQSSKR